MCPPEPERREVAPVPDYHRKDPFYERAKREGYRSRAAYKLLEIQKRQKLLRPGQRVVDLGCWPGGWLQVASRIVGPKGRVVGVDVAELDPPLLGENVVTLVGDLESPEICEQVRTALGGRAHLVMSDAAPKITGVREVDRAREERLLEAVEGLIPELLRPHGDLLMKILEAPEAQAVERRLRARFARARSLRPAASRKGSSERYLIARDFSA